MKKVGDCYYVHRSNIAELLKAAPGYAGVFRDITSYADSEGIPFEVIKYDSMKGTLSLIDSPDFNSAPEPVVGDSYVFDIDGWDGNPPRRIIPMKKNPQIYHMKETFVDPDYSGFDVEKARQRSKATEDIRHKYSNRIGYQSFWEERLREANIPLRNKKNGVHLTPSEIKRYNNVDQQYPSDATSINSRTPPRIYNIGWVVDRYIAGKQVIDLAAGVPRYFNQTVGMMYANVTPRDPFNYPKDINDMALTGVYDTAILSNVLNVIKERENIIDLLNLAKKIADATLITVYEAKKPGPTGRGRYQRGQRLKDYLPLCYEVFGPENVRVFGNVIVCEGY
ncbi:MAG: hypothetical protein E7Z63_00975 [Thermoplasmata archaeon]|nr:hypothetical protein [Thermoplasmata archaeon]